jgi:hypothetical protein
MPLLQLINQYIMFRHLLKVPKGLFLPLIIALQLISGNVTGQLDPAAQPLPFTPDFSGLVGTTTVYPAGFVGWGVPGSLSTTVLTAAPTFTVIMSTGQTDAGTTAFVGSMVGKIGILSQSSTVRALGMAVNTSSVTSGNVQLIFTAATQGQTAGGYIDELDLQYRIGTSGSFTTVAGAAYQNDALSTTTTTTTTDYNPSTLYVTLPAACTNQPVVELRWIARNVSGSGTNHPSFSVTNITVQAQTTTEYYCLATGNLDNVTTWGTNTDGTGTHPANFTADGEVFHIINGNPCNLSGNWNITGANSKILVDRSDFTTSTTKTITATIDVNPLRTLTFSNIADSTSLTLGNLDMASTVIFSGMTNFPVPVNAAYGNITFNNTTIEAPSATELLEYAGNFTLQGTSSFVSGSAASVPATGISLITIGNNDQVINSNGLPLTIYDFNVGYTNPKAAGTVSLAPLTTVNALNHFIGNVNGSALFEDNGNIIEIGNNLDLSGTSSNYNITGTIWMNGIGSGTQVIRGGSGAIAAAVNNIVFNSTLIHSRIAAGTFVVKGNLTITDTVTSSFALDFSGNSLALAGNFISRTTLATDLIAGTPSTITFNGSTAQTYSSAVPGGETFYNFTMNNSAGLTLTNSSVNVAGTLTMTSGLISTGANVVTVTSGGNVVGASAASYVKGAMSKVIAGPATAPSRTYEIGDTTYSPVNLTFPGTTSFPGPVLVRSTYGPHPAIATSYVNTSNYVNRYWTVTNQGGLTVTSGGLNISFSYNNGDMTGTPNTNYTIRKYSGSAWTTAPSVTNITTGVLPLMPDVSKTSSVTATSFSGDYVAGNVDCAVSGGTVTVSPSAICGSGTSILSSVTTSNTGNSYQWLSSPTGSTWTAIAGATTAVYTATLSATTYYMCTVGCIPTLTSVNSTVAIVTVNPLPSAISGTFSACSGTSQTLSDATGGGTWSSSNPGVVTIGSTGIYSGPVAGTSIISYTLPTGCYATAAVSNLVLPSPPWFSSSLMSFCPASTATLLTASADTVYGSISLGSNTSSFVEPKNNSDTSSIVVTGVPPGATITGVSVSFTIGGTTSPSTGSIQKDDILNLRAPNGNKINLINSSGSNTPGTGSFNNVTISSAGTTPIVLGTALVPGLQYIASLANNVGATIPAGYKSNTTSWSNLYSIPNGKWTFITDNTFNGTEDTFKNWSITINYVIYPAITWSPISGLYTNTSGTAYTTGTVTGNVYVLPTVTTTYIATSQSGACSNSSSIEAVYGNPLYVSAPQGASAMCGGSSVTLTDSISGGTWSSGNTGVATVGSLSGIVTGSTAGTAVISYAINNGGCSGFATKIVTVTASPPAISGNLSVCLGSVTTLSDATAGTWTASNGNAIIGTSGVVTTVSPGLDTIAYTSPIGCATTAVLTVNAMPTLSGVSASTGSLCAGGSFTLSAGTLTGSGSPSSYNWSGPGGYSTSGTMASIAVTPATIAGSGTYSLSVSYPGAGCITNTSVTSTAVTVNAIPTVAGITSSTNSLCVGGTFTLTAGTASGIGSLVSYNWSGPNAYLTSGTSATATLTPGTTAASGVYSLSVTYPGSGCTSLASVTVPAVTVNAIPTVASINSSSYLLCTGATFTLTAGATTGAGSLTSYSWSGPNGYNTTSLASSTALTASSTAVSGVYSLSVTYSGIGCTSGAPVTSAAIAVNTLPTVGGVTASANALCIGGSFTLNAGAISGTGSLTSYNWSGLNGYLSSGAVASTVVTPATIASSGIYSLSVTYPGTGCTSAAVVTSPAVTVNALPTVSGVTASANSLCAGATFTLTAGATTGAGTLSSYNWSGPNAYAATGLTSTSVVSGTTTSSSGVYSLTVSYTGSGCTSTTSVTSPAITVNVQPAAISGSLSLCNSTMTSLTDLPAGGVWSRTGTNVSIDGSGDVTGLALGTSTISYTIGSCYATKTITVNASPPAISGTRVVCLGGSTELSDLQAGGTWLSGSGSVTIDGSGNIFGASTGTAAITYSLGGSCSTSSIVTVNALPTISGVTSSSSLLCTGGTFTLTAGSATGTGAVTSYNWSGPTGYSATSAGATITLTPATTAASGIYSLSVTYIGAGCVSSEVAVPQAVTVNALPSSAPSNGGAICNGSVADLFANSSNATAWVWSGPAGFSSTLQNPTFSPTATATYSLTVSSMGTGCAPGIISTTTVTVNPLPGSISGVDSVYIGSFVTLSDGTPGGSWASISGNVTVGTSTGVVTGVSSGTSVITYALSTGCSATFVVTVLAVPPAITGTMNVCPGTSTTLSDLITGGTWTSSNGNVTVGSSFGSITGVTAGTSIITYTFPSGSLAVYATITVNPLPSAIFGTLQVCQELMTGLSDTSSTGVWSSSNGNATVGSATGMATGVTPGLDTVTYTISATGCAISATVTVNALPLAVTGTAKVCEGLSVGLSDATAGGTWSSSNTNATVGSSGVVTGAVAGTSIITYELNTGCISVETVTVNPLPNSIAGAGNVCVGSMIALSDDGGGSWSSSNTNVLIGSTGSVTGSVAGTSEITYTLPTTCIITTVVTVNAVVVPSINILEAAGDTVCAGTTVIFTTNTTGGGTTPGFQWTLNGSFISGATNDSYNYTPLNGDTVAAVLTSNAVCAMPASVTGSVIMTVLPVDTGSVDISATPGDTVCQGAFALVSALGANGGTAPLYLWTVNGTQVATGPTFGFFPNSGDNVFCTMVSNLRCVAADTVTSNHLIMQVDSAYVPVVEVTMSRGPGDGTFQTDTFRATVTHGGPAPVYQWFVNNTAISGATTAVFTATDFGNNDSVSCVVTGTGPCGYASFNSIIVAIFYSGVQQVTLGAENIRLVPNPNKGMFTITGSLGIKGDNEVYTEITDMLGQVVYKSTIASVGGIINAPVSLSSDLSNGMYLLNLRSGSEHIVLHFVVAQ